MEATREIFVGDIGTVLVIRIWDILESGVKVVVDISTATEKKIKFQKPDKTVVIKNGTFYTDGKDGKLKYVTESEFLDQPGTWAIEGYIEFPGATQWHTTIGYFSVKNPLG